VMYDREADLLTEALARVPVAADGSLVTVETRLRDLTRLDPAELEGASLVTASALLDMLTAEEVERLVGSCRAAGCPALLTLSVVGRVELSRTDPLDVAIAQAFNDHQRRVTGDRQLLGPDAVEDAADLFTRLGYEVTLRPSPWRLGAGQAELADAWLTGWVTSACEQRPELTVSAPDYLRRRRADAASGELVVTVQHVDLLVRP
jgi:hypothetical protein